LWAVCIRLPFLLELYYALIIFKPFLRSEYGAFWKCMHAGFIYALTQLGKMLLLATFFPTAGDYLEDDPESFSPVII